MVEIFSNIVSGIIRQLLIAQICSSMNELGFRFSFGLYIISCIIMRDTSQKVYHGLAGKIASGQVRSIFYPTNNF